MRWEGRRQSENVEDRRGIGGPVLVGGGLITLLLMLAMMFLGFDPQMVAQIAPGPRGAPAAGAGEADQRRDDQDGEGRARRQ
jgi:uncharacterized protein